MKLLPFFKFIAICEGLSLLILLFIAMPLKYILHQPEYVRFVGMAHGLLFISYILLAIALKRFEQWEWKKFTIISLASVVPFGTFYIEKKHL
jgi:integral membrane protein